MKPPAPRALVLAALALVLALGLAACANKKAVVSEAETEGPYLDVAALKYQVQISRQLNAADVEDRPYLVGVAPQDAQLRPDETWFAVFLRVQNETHRPRVSAGEFEITDTAGRRFKPVPISNPFAYRPVRIPAQAAVPPESSIAGDSPIGGSLLLFKLTLESLANRPLQLRIAAQHHEAIVDLDV